MNHIIFAMDLNGGIGRNGDLPWGRQYPEDLKRFRELTTGKGNNAVIMGRKTWESLKGKPLAGRLNIVVSRRPEPTLGPRGEFWVRSLDEALVAAGQSDERFVIGGGELYQVAFAHPEFCQPGSRIYMTTINRSFSCDTFIYLPWSEMRLEEEESAGCGELAFETYSRTITVAT